MVKCRAWGVATRVCLGCVPMDIGLKALWLLAIASPFVLGGAAAPANLEIRLENHLTSYSSAPGTPFRCVVIRSFNAAGHVLIPKGSTVFGRVRKRQAVGLGLIHERAGLDLTFDRYQTPAGDIFPLEARLASIDNAREEVTPAGHIKGVLAASNPGNLLNGFWARPSSSLVFRSIVGLTGAVNQVWARYSMGPAGAAGLFVARCFLVAFPEPEIHLPPGTDMKLRVTLRPAQASRFSALATTKPLPSSPRMVPVAASTGIPSQPAESFSEWLRPKLDSISRGDKRPAPDLINVILFGSREQVTSAFTTSGWSSADPRTLRSSSRTYEAFSSMRNYASAPVSRLFYRGQPPELVFEKSFDTVTQRHHVRFWDVGSFQNQEVWLGAATHDTGIRFKLRSITFTHRIDKDIDVERAKVATDLDFAGCAEEPEFWDGAVHSGLYQSKSVNTDGKLAVLQVHSCEPAVSFDDPPRPPGNKFTRLTRRAVLETRNYLLRDNAYYWTYRMLRKERASHQNAE